MGIRSWACVACVPIHAGAVPVTPCAKGRERGLLWAPSSLCVLGGMVVGWLHPGGHVTQPVHVNRAGLQFWEAVMDERAQQPSLLVQLPGSPWNHAKVWVGRDF